jgi:lipoprotein NlpD
MTFLSACSGSSVIAPLGRATIQDNVAASSQGVHRVLAGDSLYSIAWRYGVDYRDLARWNAVAEPYTIHPQRILQVSRPAVLPPMPTSGSRVASTRKSKPQVAAATPGRPASRTKHRKPSTPTSSKPKPTKPVKAPRATRPTRVVKTAQQASVRKWRWPVKGRVIGSFGKAGGKGIDIAGSRGRPIEATAPGTVVYSGSGLRGYGQLIIIKHNKRYLSAYAHNDRLHVKEGDAVQGGQRIAEMGDSGTKSVRLHFEIRRDGKPVDPAQFLPR